MLGCVDDEEIVLLDEQLQPVGTAPKLASHHDRTPLHLAFSCYLFNEKGQLLLTKRAASKKVWPDVWTNSICGHPLPGESFAGAIARRAQFEVGISRIDGLRPALPAYRYRTPPRHKVIENEFCPVFIATIGCKPRINADEVAAYRWISWDRLGREVSERPDIFSYWLKDQLPLLNVKYGNPATTLDKHPYF